MTRLMGKRAAMLGLAGVALLGLALPAAAADDATLQGKIEARLRKARFDQATDIRVSVEQGRATLSGVATSLDAQREALRAARKETADVVDRIALEVPSRPDAAVLKDAQRAILGYVHYGVFDSVGLAVKDGAVTLTGSVREPYRRDDIVERIAEVRGVRAIADRIDVQPVSLFDDRLRAELVRKIYGSDLFSNYAYWADPPIHIIVNNGHVTLTGYVNSEVERRAVGMIARGTLAFGVDNRVRLESEPGGPDAPRTGTD